MLYNGTTSINIDAVNEGLREYYENYNKSFNQQQPAFNNSASYDYYCNQPQYQQNYYDPVVAYDYYGNPITQSQQMRYQQWCYDNPPIIGLDGEYLYEQNYQPSYYNDSPIITESAYDSYTDGSITYVDETQQEEVNPFIQAQINEASRKEAQMREQEAKDNLERCRQEEQQNQALYIKQNQDYNNSLYNRMRNPAEYYELIRIMRTKFNDPFWVPNDEEVYELNYDIEMDKLYKSEKIRLQMIFDENQFFDSPLIDDEKAFKMWDKRRKERMYYCKDQMDKIESSGVNNRWTKMLYDLYERGLFSNQREYEVVMQMTPENKAHRINIMLHPELDPKPEVGTNHNRKINGDYGRRPSFAGRRGNYVQEYNFNPEIYNPYDYRDRQAHNKAMDIINRAVRKSLGVTDEEYSNKIQKLRDFDKECGERLQYLREQQKLNNLDMNGNPNIVTPQMQKDMNLQYNLAMAQQSTEGMSIYDYMKKLQGEAYKYAMLDIKKEREKIYNKVAYRRAIEETDTYKRTNHIPLQYNSSPVFEDQEQEEFKVSMEMAKTLHEINQSGKATVKMNEGSITGPTIKINFNQPPISEVMNKAGTAEEYDKRKEEFIRRASMRNNRGR